MRPSTFHRGPARVRANLTPMIDVTFLLLIFFVLVTQITNRQVIEDLDLPKPDQAVSVEPGEEARLIINVVPGTLGVRTYRVGIRDYDPTAQGLVELTAELSLAIEEQSDLEVDVRADRGSEYSQVYPAIRAAVLAGVPKVNLVVEASGLEGGGSGGAGGGP